MNAYVEIKNKKTGEVLNTDEHGVFVIIHCEADGNVVIDELGTCVDNSTRTEPDTTEKYFDVADYEVLSIDFSD